MVFNSINFAIFFCIFFVLYWFVFSRNLGFQNALLLIGSYVFYAWWDWRFLVLLAASTTLGFFLGIRIRKASTEDRSRQFLLLGLGLFLGTLVLFKYINFLITSFAAFLSIADLNVPIHHLDILLPLGISFYTFRLMSYLLDVYGGSIEPSTDWIVFSSYVGFFPSLMSGPIDRAAMLVPQLENERTFSYDEAADGMRQVLWGLFKKIVVANNCAKITQDLLGSHLGLPASTLLVGAFLYTIQLYADFSGYSDMAIGFARLLGFRITKNFSFPFFAQSIPEYWRRWHISLTSWMTDYVFTPLNFKFRVYGRLGLVLAIIVNFIVVGIWHGASWAFVLYGFLHGCYFIPLILRGTYTDGAAVSRRSAFSGLVLAAKTVGTFLLVMCTNVLFWAGDTTLAARYMRDLLSRSILSVPRFADTTNALIAIVFSILLLGAEWVQRKKEHGLRIEHIGWAPIRWGIYLSIFVLMVVFATSSKSFIYFEF